MEEIGKEYEYNLQVMVGMINCLPANTSAMLRDQFNKVMSSSAKITAITINNLENMKANSKIAQDRITQLELENILLKFDLDMTKKEKENH